MDFRLKGKDGGEGAQAYRKVSGVSFNTTFSRIVCGGEVVCLNF